MLGRKKKVQDCDYVFGSSTKFQRGMTGFVKADICRQVSVCLRVFCGISFALKPFRDYSLCSVCILPQSAFYSQSVVCILHSVCILPLVRSLQSAVRSPQSAVFVLHWSVWKFYKDLFLNFRVIWSVNQIVLFNGFLSDFVEITLCAYTKTIILFKLG